MDVPTPWQRYQALFAVSVIKLHHPQTDLNLKLFITIEPVLDFDVDVLSKWIIDIKPDFINLGADSKNHNLDEPSIEKIEALVAALHEGGVELREKHNLQRLRKK